jgi:hypothetical protein
LCEQESKAALFFHVFPNISITIYPHSVYTLIMLPDGNGATKEQLTLLMTPGAKKQTDEQDVYERKCEELMDFVVQINDEDVVAIENLQKGLHGARRQNVQGEFLPQYDWTIHRFQNMVIEGLRGATVDESIMPALCTEFEKLVAAAVKGNDAAPDASPFMTELSQQLERVTSAYNISAALEERSYRPEQLQLQVTV